MFHIKNNEITTHIHFDIDLEMLKQATYYSISETNHT